MNEEPRIGIALGGGAARGLAHLGVLRALDRIGIPIRAIAGTSMGALIGSLYAVNGSIAEAEARIRGFLGSPEFAHMRLRFLRERERPASAGIFYSVSSLIKRGMVLGYTAARASFIPAEEFAAQLEAILPDVAIERTRIPLVVVAADLNSGREIGLVRGSLRSAVAGSCAIPGVLPPAAVDGMALIDGGWVNKVPVRPARGLGARFVIAIDVAQDLEDSRAYRSGLNIVTRANAICSNRLRELQAAEAEFLIRPAVQAIHWADFSRLEDAIALGEEAVLSRKDELLALLDRGRLLDRFRFWRGEPAPEER